LEHSGNSLSQTQMKSIGLFWECVNPCIGHMKIMALAIFNLG
jgi:hypothetical protein